LTMNTPGHPHGEEVVKVRVDEIRALGFMPRDVEVVGFITQEKQDRWVPEGERYLYLHIKSTISPSRPEGTPLYIDKLLSFYDRYASLRSDWANKLNSDLAMYRGG
jgi:hypothetical protein